MVPAVDAASLTAANIEPPTGANTVETERANYIWVSPILCKGRLRGYTIHVYYYRIYVTTEAATYYYRMYAQPVVINYDGTITNLEAERLIKEYSRGAATTTGYLSDAVNAVLRVSGIDLPFNGLLGLRLRTTSWASTVVTNGHGFASLNDPSAWGILFDVEVEP